MREWQTIEEFNKIPMIGWCWIRISFGLIDMAYFSDGIFYYNDLSGLENRSDEIWDIEYITHVMLITEPDDPK